MGVKELLEEEIADEFDNLKPLIVGSEDHKIAIDTVSKLLDRAIELEKIESDREVKTAQREADLDVKYDQMQEDRKGRRVRTAIDILGIVVPTVVTIWGTVASFKFEKTDNITTIMGRGFINNLLPKKK